MSHLIQFIETVREVLTPDEWKFFSSRYIDCRDLPDAAAAVVGYHGGAEELQQTVLRKLRDHGGRGT